ncbi:MAG: histidinol-phosphatase [Oscillospiraceae bacterium]|nr:histidinol-phosphatase [Oscillospiraceae bacterium]
MKANLHTHTFRCHHARGNDEDYVLAAIENGYTKLGFSDHTPFPYDNGYVNRTKMLPEELDGYVQSVLSLKEKYKDKIEILLGLECEAVPRFFPYLKEISKDMDYLILGNHGDWSIGEPYGDHLTKPWQFHRYFATAVEAMESGLFLYLAHPDLFLAGYPEFDEEAKYISRLLCREANRLKIPLEYNLYGLIKCKNYTTLGYPYSGFWEIAAEENVTAVVGVDAHDPKEFGISDLDSAKRYLRSLGIRVLDDPMDAKK